MSNMDGEGSESHAKDEMQPPRPPDGGEMIVPSTALMEGRREIIILHAGLRYRLRITSNDKLILTK